MGFVGGALPLPPPQVAAVRQTLIALAPVAWVHLGLGRGADAQVYRLARDLGQNLNPHWVWGHPVVGPRQAWSAGISVWCDQISAPCPPGTQRRQIVDACEVLLAAPSAPEDRELGEWLAVRYARLRRKPRAVVFPHGRLHWEKPWKP